jgi:putative tryptophan/tyrosine transport system substrate-binding protein
MIAPNLIMLVLVLLLAQLADTNAAQAQQRGKLPWIGFVSGIGDPNTPGPHVEAFRQGLRTLGYMEGQNIAVEYRYAENRPDRNPSLVTELVQLNVDILVVAPQLAIRAAKEATRTIPIVMVSTADPVASGIIDSLARPGGNITGVTRLATDLSGKRLELLKETVGRLSRVGLLWNANARGAVVGVKEYEEAARALKLALQSLEVRDPNPDLEGAFQAATKSRVSALITLNPAMFSYAKRIADLAMKNRLPAMSEASSYVEDGGLISYSANEAENFRRAAYYVDKILKGAKPADLPVERPTKFEFVINLKTAKQIGLTIPPNVLARADRVIK